MSACNVVVLPEVAYLFADAAGYDREGRVSSISGKTFLMSSISAAMIATGRSVDSIFIAGELESRAESFDDLVANASVWMPEVMAACEGLFGADDHGLGQRLTIAGWSEKRKACYGFGLSTFDDTSGHRAFQVIPVEGGMQAPVLTPEELVRGFGHLPGMEDVADIEHMALTVLELQRQQKLDWADGKHLVGGLIELVTIQRDRIESRVLRRWPDKVGEFITPAPVDWPAWRSRKPSPMAGNL